MNNYRFYFAQAYGEGVYSGCTYNNSCAGTNTSGGSKQLTNTGFDIFLLVTLACFLIFVALVVRLWRKKRSSGTTDKPRQDSDRQNPPDNI